MTVTLGPLTRAVLDAMLGDGAYPLRCFEHAYELGLLPVLIQHVSDRTTLPSTVTSRWREEVVRARLVLHGAQRLVAHLAHHDVNAVILKGPVLSQLLFDDALMRSTSDVDMLVHPRDVAKALQHLQGADCQPVADAPLKPWAYNQRALIYQPWSMLVELHWALALPSLPSPSVTHLLADAAPPQSGLPATLSVEHTLFSLVYHFQQHHGAPKTVVDLAAWFDRHGESADWSAIIAMARSLGVLGLIGWAHGTVAMLAAQPLPGPSWPDRWVCRTWTQISAALCRGILARETIPDVARLFIGRDDLSDKLAHVAIQTLALWPLDRFEQRVLRSLQWLMLGPHRSGTQLANMLRRCEMTLPGLQYFDRTLS